METRWTRRDAAERNDPDRGGSRWRRAIAAVAVGTAVGVLLVPVPAGADLDVVFVLDTTGSMGSEIREVQERVGQLAESLAEVRAGERLRYGVVAFRDRGDEYVTRTSPLTADLAATRGFLDALSADGGGDGPEAVVAALAAALGEIAWDPAAGTERQIFLIGDAPPHLDYGDEPTPDELIAAARAARIAINTIGCRSLPADGVEFFRRIAYATEGSYQHIGRVRAAGEGALTEAVRRSAAAAAGIGERGEPVALSWMRHQPGVDPSGILVRYGGAGGTAQDPTGEALGACALEIRMPFGIDLATEPQAFLGSAGLEVALELAAGDPSSTGGGMDVFALAACPPITTPILVTLGG